MPNLELKPRLDADAWISEAFKLLGREGIDGVRIELLARRLGVTKGSFYWHFKDRDALHAAMLDRWRRNATSDLIQWFEQQAGPAEKFALMMRTPCISQLPEQTLEIELAIRLWSSRDKRAAAAIAEIDALRIRYTASLLVACGVAPEEARGRAILAYGHKRMLGHLMDEPTIAQCEKLLTRN